MSTTYYAIPKKLIIEKGIEAIFGHSPEDLLDDLQAMLKEGVTYREARDFRDEYENIVALGTRFAKESGVGFTPAVGYERMEEVLQSDVIITSEFHEYYSPNKFREMLDEWKD